MIRRALIEKLYEAASMQRWNDHIRPHKGFTELDKQAHKMHFAYVIARFEEEENNAAVDWHFLIEAGMFEFLHRVVVTDIKPPIFHELAEKKGRELNEWVITELGGILKDIHGDFLEKFSSYFTDAAPNLERRILKAAHYLATHWEFRFIYNLNPGLYGIDETKRSIESEIDKHLDMTGVNRALLGKTHDYLDLVGQLRFQQRWAQSQRIPETSVLGHSLIVALLGYFCSVEVNACPQRVVNNFLSGLFHDLPEVLTRDIISPVKRSVQGLEEILKEIEKQQVEKKLFPLLPKKWHIDFRYYTEDEFACKVVDQEQTIIVTQEEMNSRYNEDRYNPRDGRLLKACDDLAALLEAYLSLTSGIRSRQLVDGHKNLLEKYKNAVIGGVDIGTLFDYFTITN